MGPQSGCRGDELLQVHEAQEMLAQARPRLAKVKEMRYLGGCSEAETGEALEPNERTVRRDWDKARLLLGAVLKRPSRRVDGQRCPLVERPSV